MTQRLSTRRACELADELHRSGRELILCGARHQPSELIARADFHRRVGDPNVCANIRDALERARVLHALRRTMLSRDAN
jgi:SulP family sulfate permease